jgi:hypothetical protein
LLVPNPYNPQDLNRYSYVRNNPLRYTDPSGHVPQALLALAAYAKIVAVNVVTDTLLDAGLALLTGESFDLIESVKTNLAIDAATAGVGGKIAKSGKIASLLGKYLDNLRPAGRAIIERMRLGESAFETIERFGIKPFREFTSVEKKGKPAHHLVEKRFWRQLGFSSAEEAEDSILAVIIEPGLHGPQGKGEKTLTDKIRDALGYRLSGNATLSEIWIVHRDVYEEFGREDWARLIWEAYFRDQGIPYK